MELAQEDLQRQCITCVYQRYRYKCARNLGHKNNPYYGYTATMQQHKKARTRGQLWRPWTDSTKSNHSRNQKHHCTSEVLRTANDNTQGIMQFQHPVKLVWPKKPYDYMYTEGERLLRDFPVQATLEFITESDSESEDED